MAAPTKLEEVLSKFQKDVDSWANSQNKILADEISHHKTFMSKYQDTSSRLTTDELQLKGAAEELKINMMREQMELEKARCDTGVLQAQQDALPEHLDFEKKRFQIARTTTENKHQEVDNKERELRKQLNESTHGTSFYKDRLGLDFEKIQDNSLRFCFTKIDPTSPSRRFIFLVSVDENDKYKVEGCKPEIESLVALVDKLNATNNFSGFVQSVRKQFQAKCIKK